MAIEVKAGTYLCTLMKQDDGTAAIGLDEHYEWDAAKRDLGAPCGGCQVLFGANAYTHHPEAAGTDNEWEYAGKIVCDMFGYTLIQSDRMKKPGEEYAWRVDALADALGVSADQLFDLRAVKTEEELLAAQIEIEVQAYTRRDGKTGLSVNWIGKPGTHGGGTRAIGGQTKNKALFAKFAAHARATRGGHAAPTPAPALQPRAAAPAPAPAAKLPSRPAPAAPAAPTKWEGPALWERWLSERGDTSEQFYATLDKILGRDGVEPSDLTQAEAQAVAEHLGWATPASLDSACPF